MPSLVNKTEEVASKELTDAGLKVEVVYEEDTTKTNGVVLKQSVDVGKVVDEGTTVVITVNQIVETKSANIYVNVKSLTGGYTENVNAELSDNDKKVQLKVTSGEDTIFNEKVDKNETKVSTRQATGKGIITVKVFIDDVRVAEKQIDLNTTTEYTFD